MLRRFLPAVLPVVLLAVLQAASYARADFPLDRLAPGLRGHAVTAGAGNILEEFPITVLGVQYDAGTGFPLILVRADGPFIEAAGGVAAGMSGSPVYLPLDDGEALLGAIAFVFPNSDHRLALVTPIEAMRGALPPERGASFGDEWFRALGPAVPVATPLLLAGVGGRAIGALEPLLRRSPVDLLPVQSGGVVGALDDAYRLEPGSAVSVQLVRGDITVAAIGTVTAIENGQVLAFGHPLLGQGPVSFALAPAFISHIVPSNVVPFKLANSGRRLLGSITQDRPAAVAGPLDAAPDFLPVTLTLVGPDGLERQHFEVTRDERYYAPLLAAATLQTLDEALQRVGAGTSGLAWEITLADGSVVRLLEQTTDGADIAAATARLAAEPLAILAGNSFAAADIAEVTLNVELQDEQRFAEIVEVKAERSELEPGGTLVAFLRLQPYRQEAELRTVRVPLPDELEGNVSITFRGGFRAADEGDDNDEPLLSFGELLIALRENVQASELIVETTIDGETRRLERQTFPYLLEGEETIDITIKTAAAAEDEPEPAPAPDEAMPEVPQPRRPGVPKVEPQSGG